MRREFSLYLDFVRVGAALLVFIHHLNIPLITLKKIPLGNLGEFGVICFFVMSGCVIAFVTDKSERSLSVYAASRLSKIYSVAIPTILIVPLLDGVGRNVFGDYPNHFPFDRFALRLLISGAFLNEVWGQSVLLFSDSPYWSLCYEVWYYVAFGIAFYVKSAWRNCLLLLVAVLVGPKILLMAPIWLMGVWLYHLDKRGAWSSSTYLASAVLGALGVFTFEMFDVHAIFKQWTQAILPANVFDSLLHAKGFLGDWVLGALMALHLFGMKKANVFGRQLLLAVERPLRYLAKYTFALYLLHQPLIYFWRSAFHLENTNVYGPVILSILVVGSVFCISIPIEQLRRLLKRSFGRLLLRPGASVGEGGAAVLR